MSKRKPPPPNSALRALPPTAAEVPSFRRVRWPTGAVLVGVAPVAALAAFAAAGDPSWPPAVKRSVLVPLVVLAFLWMLGYPLLVAARHGGLPRPPSLRTVAVEAALAVPVVALVWLALAAGYVLWSLAFGPESAPANPLDRPGLGRLPGLAVAAVVVLAVGVGPACEEVFFRGMLYNALRQRVRPAAAAVGQAAAFGLCHLSYGPGYAIVAGLFGLALAGVYEWRRTLAAPLAVHALQNAAVVAVGLWASA